MNSQHELNYYFEMDKAKESDFAVSVRTLKLGQTYQSVVETVGKPDHDQVLHRKDGVFVARVLTYYVQKWEKDLVNEKHDRLVRLEFDSKDLLTRIVSNVDGIPSVN